MARYFKKGFKKAGSAPGTLVHVGEQRLDAPRIAVMDYDAEALRERRIDGIEAVFPLRDLPTTTWVNIDGLHDLDLIEKTGAHFGIHPLTLEDIVNTGHRPKIEAFDDYLFLVLKMLHYNEQEEVITAEQVSFVLGPHWLISFQEAPGDLFDPVRERIRKGRGRIRKAGCDYLAYALMDAVVDHYFHILEKIGTRIETAEEQITEDPRMEILHTIHALKREVIFLRKQIWPLREIVSHLAKAESDLIQESTQLFLGDVHDHVIQVIDTVESYRDLLGGMQDLYLSMAGNRMNEVMKVLTIIATIFIPITFVAGIYGMNFKHMPELDWPWGYGLAWAVMAAIAGGLVVYFRKKKWF